MRGTSTAQQRNVTSPTCHPLWRQDSQGPHHYTNNNNAQFEPARSMRESNLSQPASKNYILMYVIFGLTWSNTGLHTDLHKTLSLPTVSSPKTIRSIDDAVQTILGKGTRTGQDAFILDLCQTTGKIYSSSCKTAINQNDLVAMELHYSTWCHWSYSTWGGHDCRKNPKYMHHNCSQQRVK